METEVRFFFNSSYLLKLKSRLSGYKFLYSAYEQTIMYDNPNPMLSFYDPSIDGRLRFRIIKRTNCLLPNAQSRLIPHGILTWKRRLRKKNSLHNIHQEEEIECALCEDDLNNMRKILEKVMKCPRISSYERIRHSFETKNVKITLDEFPFGLMLEFELIKGDDFELLIESVKEFGLDVSNASTLSCDDKYFELCNKNFKKPKADILFSDKEMPKI